MNSDFHFHEWVFLAQVDAQAFERRRARLIDEFLRKSGAHRPQLEALQRKIDQQRSAAATPEEAVVAISGQMCKSFCTLIGEIAELRADLQRLRSLTSSMVLADAADMAASAGTAAQSPPAEVVINGR